MKKNLLKSLTLSVLLLNFNQAWSKNTALEDPVAAQQAWAYLNGIRQDLKLPTLMQHQALQKSAGNHALYQVFNNQQGHQQSSKRAKFSGEWPNDRAYMTGYHSQVSEVISYNAERPQQYIDDLMSAIYHRLGLLDMSKDEVGIRVFKDNQGLVTSALVANLGNRNLNQACQRSHEFLPGSTLYGGLCKGEQRLAQTTVEQIQKQTAQNSPKLLVWPKPGATVSPVFYEESPDPLPQCNVSGYPAHIQINPNYWGRIHLKTNSFTLTNLDTAESIPPITIFNNITDPQKQDNNPNQERWLAFFPHHRLAWNGRYQAQVQWVENGSTQTQRWTFYTPKLSGLHVVTTPKLKLQAKPGDTLHLYFPPKGCNASPNADLQTDYSRNLVFKTEFIDVQTLKVEIGNKTGQLILTYQPTKTQVTIEIR